jgi:hypothetical protein
VEMDLKFSRINSEIKHNIQSRIHHLRNKAMMLSDEEMDAE